MPVDRDVEYSKTPGHKIGPGAYMEMSVSAGAPHVVTVLVACDGYSIRLFQSEGDRDDGRKMGHRYSSNAFAR